MPPPIHPDDEVRRGVAASMFGAEYLEIWLAVTAADVLVGYAAFTPTWLDGLYVDPARQGSGIGSALLDLVKSLRPDGFGLWVFASNTPAIAFYERRGLLERERTDGRDNMERSPDVRMEWPGSSGTPSTAGVDR